MQGQEYTRNENKVAAYRSPPLQVRTPISSLESALCWHVLQALTRSALRPAYRFHQDPNLAALPCLSITSPAVYLPPVLPEISQNGLQTSEYGPDGGQQDLICLHKRHMLERAHACNMSQAWHP